MNNRCNISYNVPCKLGVYIYSVKTAGVIFSKIFFIESDVYFYVLVIHFKTSYFGGNLN